MALADGFRLPRRFAVVPLWENAGWGEDDPIRMMRMQRDGWPFVQDGQQGIRWHEPSARRSASSTAETPEIIGEAHEHARGPPLHAADRRHGRFERDGRSNLETADDRSGPDHGVLRDLGRIDWADLDHNGDVLWAWAGKLWRLTRTKRVAAFADADAAPARRLQRHAIRGDRAAGFSAAVVMRSDAGYLSLLQVATVVAPRTTDHLFCSTLTRVKQVALLPFQLVQKPSLRQLPGALALDAGRPAHRLARHLAVGREHHLELDVGRRRRR